MTAIESPEQLKAMREALAERRPLSKRWRELHTLGQLIALKAQLASEPFEGRIANFPDAIVDAAPWHRELAEQALEDIDAMLQPGLTALQAIEARGHDVTAPALALWREFYHAREGLLSLAPKAVVAQTETD
ncbi:hypothetical protein [Altererythrobacter sp. GH1-8]|uniref:hypothetical protein n=1 Tax=Altererythrobacter sp. GH1-8 TaxID=3349333 RepID=UPI00374D7833